jgi:hypothetical protein
MKIGNESLEYLSSSKISYKELDNAFLPEQEGEHLCGYRALWRAVITQALMDAGSNSNKLEMKKEKARAIEWLNSESDDFKEVCGMAGMDYTYVRRKSIEAIKNGCKWRMESIPFLQMPILEYKMLKVA